jgi:hypothetical protein
MLLLRAIAAISIINAFLYALILALCTIEYGWRNDTFAIVTAKQFSRSRTLIHYSFMSSAFGFCAALFCLFCSCFNLQRGHRRIVSLLCLTLSFIAFTTGILSSGFGIAVLMFHDYQIFDELMMVSLLDMVALFVQSICIMMLFNKEIHDHNESMTLSHGRDVY